MIEVDVRVIAATNKDLEREMEAGRFRQDLFYRLNVIPLRVPPLRERKEDIPLLVDRFLREFAEKEGEPVKTMTPDALEILMQHDWPGNVRELKNLIERLAILVPSPVIDAQDIPSFSITPNETDSSVTLDVAGSLREAKMEFERQFILQKLRENDWNISRTAEVIGLERSNLHRKIRSYGIEVKGD